MAKTRYTVAASITPVLGAVRLGVAIIMSLVPAHVAFGQADRVFPSAEARAISGCYQLRIGTWADTEAWHESGRGQWVKYLPPDRLFFDSIPYTVLAGPRRIVEYHVRAASSRLGYPLSAWSFLSRDSVRVVWSNGFSGAEMWLHVKGDTLVGRIAAFDDVIDEKPVPRASVAGIRAACS